MTNLQSWNIGKSEAVSSCARIVMNSYHLIYFSIIYFVHHIYICYIRIIYLKKH